MDTERQAARALAPIGGDLAGADVTHVIFILDRSGSMQGREADVIGGFNSYVQGLRGQPGVVGLSYVRFDEQIELVWNDLPLADVPEMTAEHYQPRGSTALVDAVGMTVSAVQPNAGHSYVVIVHTDGLENASREWTNEKVKALMKQREDAGNWTFSFFGCDIETWGQAGAWGMSAGAHMKVDPNDMRGTYTASARAMNVKRGRGIRSSKQYAAATAAAAAGATDDEIERLLREDADADPGA